MNSLANTERRRKQVRTRLDRKWQPERTRPVMEPANIRYEVSDRISATDAGGIGLMRSVVQCLGVAELIDNRLALLVEDKGFKELMLESEHLAEWEHQPHRARGTFYGNWAHMIIGALAWNLKIWLELLLHHIDAQRAETIIRMEYRTFINLIIRIPTQVLFQARRLVLRLLRVNKWTDLLINAPPILHRLKLA